MNSLRPWLAAFLGGVVAACSGGGGDDISSVPGQISWTGSNNGSTVLGGNGATFYFSTGSGCMFSAVNGVGPNGFCLSSTSGASGATNCSNPSSNSACDAASFRVYLTYPNSGSGCIAVVGAVVPQNYAGPSGTSVSSFSQTQPLNITSSGGGFSIQTYRPYGYSTSNASAPTAYSAYWNGQIPSCGGTHPHVGTYTIQANATCTSGPVSNANFVYTASFGIDSSGILADNGTKRYFGQLPTSGTSGMFTGLPSATVGSVQRFTVYTINSGAANGSGKWVFSGTYSPATEPFNCGTFSGSFTATEN